MPLGVAELLKKGIEKAKEKETQKPSYAMNVQEKTLDVIDFFETQYVYSLFPVNNIPHAVSKEVPGVELLIDMLKQGAVVRVKGKFNLLRLVEIIDVEDVTDQYLPQFQEMKVYVSTFGTLRIKVDGNVLNLGRSWNANQITQAMLENNVASLDMVGLLGTLQETSARGILAIPKEIFHELVAQEVEEDTTPPEEEQVETPQELEITKEILKQLNGEYTEAQLVKEVRPQLETVLNRNVSFGEATEWVRKALEELDIEVIEKAEGIGTRIYYKFGNGGKDTKKPKKKGETVEIQGVQVEVYNTDRGDLTNG